MCSLIVKSPTDTSAGFDPERSRPKWADRGAGLLLRVWNEEHRHRFSK
jgi:hypothetical protein